MKKRYVAPAAIAGAGLAAWASDKTGLTEKALNLDLPIAEYAAKAAKATGEFIDVNNNGPADEMLMIGIPLATGIALYSKRKKNGSTPDV